MLILMGNKRQKKLKDIFSFEIEVTTKVRPSGAAFVLHE